MVTQHIAVITW